MWLYVPASTASASAPAEEGLTLGSNWQSRVLARSVSWRGKLSPQAIWSARCREVSWLMRLYGAMSPPSTAAHGVASWMASLAASRASLTVSPAGDSARMTNATSGPMQDASSSSPEPGSSLSKTSPACSRRSPASIRARYGSGVTYKDWVSTLREDCSRRQKSARAMSASASSSLPWPTPASANSKQEAEDINAKRARSSKSGLMLTDVASSWPTPDAAVSNDGEEPETFFARREEVKAKGINGNGMGVPLAMAAKAWPTPAARDVKGTNSADHLQNGSGRLHLDQLPNFVEHIWMPLWATPTVKGDHNRAGMSDKSGDGLATMAASFRPVLQTYQVGGVSSHPRRSLNPLFVEWLMGWPPRWTLLAWTDFACSATALSCFKQDMRSELLRLGLPQEAPPAQLGLFG